MSDSDEEVIVSNRKNKSFRIINSDGDYSDAGEDNDSVNNGTDIAQADNGEKKSNFKLQNSDDNDNPRNSENKITGRDFDKETDVNSVPDNTDALSFLDLPTTPSTKSDDNENSKILVESTQISKLRKYKLLSDDDISDIENEPQKFDMNYELDYENSNLKTCGAEDKNKMLKKRHQKSNTLKKRKIEAKKRNRSRSSSTSENDCAKSSSPKRKVKNKKKKKLEEIIENNIIQKEKGTSSSRSEDEARCKESSGKRTSKADNKSQARQKSKTADPLLEIRSESQRRIREGRIALPYHQPKKRSLGEFLARRKNVPSIPLKPSNELLNSVCERLSKQEEEVAVFYKSESEHSENEDNNEVQFSNEEYATLKDCQIKNKDNCVSIFKEADPENILHVDKTNTSDSIYLCADVGAYLQGIGNVDAEKLSCCKSLGTNNHNDKERVESEMFAKTNIKMNAKIINNSAHHEENYLCVDTKLVKCEKNKTRENQEVDKNEYGDNNSIPSKMKNVENKEMNIDVLGASIEADVKEFVKQRSEEQIEDKMMNVNGNDKIVRTCCQQRNEDEINVDENGPTEDEADFQMLKNHELKTSKYHLPFSDSEDFMSQIQDLGIDINHSTNTEIPSQERVVTKPLSEEKKLKIRNRKLVLLSKLNVPLMANVKLNAEPGSVLQFEVASLPKSGVAHLIEKFTYHTSVKSRSQKRSPTKMNIIVEKKDSQGEFVRAVKETIEIVADPKIENKFDEDKFTIPGSKFAYFKDNLRSALISKKQANWQEYKNERVKLYGTASSDDEADEDCKSLLKKSNIMFEKQKKTPNRLNFEFYLSENEFDDDELLEDYVFKDTKKKKNDFIDEEAEVSCDEGENFDDWEEEETDFENCDDDNKANSIDCDFDKKASREDERDVGNEVINEEKEEKNERADQNQVDFGVSINGSSIDFKKPTVSNFSQLFKYNTTGSELENKVLGLENIFTQKVDNTSELTSSQIFDLCSGKFPTQIEQPVDTSVLESQFFIGSQTVEDSQNINLSLQDTNDQFSNSELNTLTDNRNSLFLSDESDTEELFTRKRKFMRIKDSDDEDDTALGSLAQLEDNDEDENSSEDDENNENMHVGENESGQFQGIGYNSEEEIINIKEKVTKEFFDHEAELSESEWGSEDEAEHGLDELEKEDGDDDDIDQEKLKEELEKIHMRRLLDDDQKDVRFLQEMLLEDGELHSDGKRERLFKWKNEDRGDFYLRPVDSDDEQVNDENDEEDEGDWRKIRYERETYISQQEKKQDLLENFESDYSNSIPVVINGLTTIPTSGAQNKSPNFKSPFSNRLKCGSFLSRRKSILSRIAAAVGESKEKVNGIKNSRNFVFGTVSPEKELPQVPVEKIEKRKISSKSIAVKKLKLSSDSKAHFTERGLLAQLASFH